MNNTDKFLKSALRKQFNAVGLRYSAEYTKKQDWYQSKQWTVAQENKFKKWFITNMMKKLKISKSKAEYEYSYYSLMWAWSVSDWCNATPLNANSAKKASICRS